jgi:hypothetical protein
VDAFLELLQHGAASPQPYSPAAGVVRERVPGPERAAHRAARMIFKKWLALRHRGVDLGLPLTDPLPGPYGGWSRVYRHGRIYWHANPRLDARLGTFVRQVETGGFGMQEADVRADEALERR